MFQSKFLVGADPEIFAVLEDKCIPPIVLEEMGLKRIGTLVPEDPDYHPVYFDDGDIKVIGDGAALEFNYKTPFENPEDFLRVWNKGLEVVDFLLPSEVEVYTKPTIPFDLEFYGRWIENPLENERLWHSCRFGCDAQFNLREELFDRRSPEVDAKDIKWRYAGGHIHCSIPEMNLQEKLAPFLYMMDYSVGLLCLVNSPYPTEESQRQEFYGIPNNHRLPYYGSLPGVEYRTPSVSWCSSQEIVEKIWQYLDKILYLIHEDMDKVLYMYAEYDAKAVKGYLEMDLDSAKEVLKEFENL